MDRENCRQIYTEFKEEQYVSGNTKLLMYGDLDQNEILYKLGLLFEQFEIGEYNKTELVRDINTQVKRILKVATDYGFDDNLWHNYLTFFIMTSENPFSITCEKVGSKRWKCKYTWLKMISKYLSHFLTMILNL